MQRVLVTGGTGLIGLEVVRLLSEQGLRPRVLVRRPSRGSLLAGLDVEPVLGDLTKPASLRRAVEGCDTVIHLAGRATMEELATLRPTLVDGTRTLAEAAGEAGVEQLVFTSSLLVHGEATTDDPIDADTPPDPRVDYGRAKVEAEEALREVEGMGGPAVAALRLPHVYGPGDLLFSRARRGLLVTPGRGHNPYAHMHIEDAARLLVAVGHARWTGTSPVADDEPASWRRFWGIVDDLYAGFRHVRVPGGLAEVGARLAGVVDPRSRPSMVTADTVVGYNLAQPVRAGLVWRDVDTELRYPTVEDGVPAVLDDSILYRWRHPVDDPRRR